MRIPTRTVVLLWVLLTFLSACASGTVDGNTAADDQSACDAAFAQAIAIDPDSDTVSTIDGAIASCGSLEAWLQAAEQNPDAFGGQDATALARERCASSLELATSTVCTEIQSN